jgi:hypothetical protein
MKNIDGTISCEWECREGRDPVKRNRGNFVGSDSGAPSSERESRIPVESSESKFSSNISDQSLAESSILPPKDSIPIIDDGSAFEPIFSSSFFSFDLEDFGDFG